ncbi:MAG TPA: RNA polymerase recycling motor HelD [Bacillota bacterium]|nr:RNA polymerase recycling motor HelD [Bacillota bacterium]
MSAVDHPAYREEVEYLDYTLDLVEESLAEFGAKETKIAKEVSKSKHRLGGDNSQAYIDLIINSKLQEGYQLKLRNLETARSKPYFARVDFREHGKAKTDRLYIGKMCLTRESDRELVIVDWRAPVANLYYEGRLGETGYHCPEGQINGEMLLKRQFSIDAGKLKEIFDIDITTNDEILQSYLGASADNRLKDIVSTIQAEQNRIIRAKMEVPLIVQGVAGSGKTTIALHRIAFLIYNYQNFSPENFMIVAPNRLFLNYISEVLPELGVELVKQTTFEDLALELIGAKLKVRGTYDKLVAFVNSGQSAEQLATNRLVRAAAEFKSSLLFKEVLEAYAGLIEEAVLPKESFASGNWVIFKPEEIKDLYYRDYKHWPFYQRIEQIKKHFRKRLKDKKDVMVQKLQTRCDLEIAKVKFSKPDTPARQDWIIRTIGNKDKRVAEIEAFAKEGVKEYFKKTAPVKTVEYYKTLFADAELFQKLIGDKIPPETAEFFRKTTLDNLSGGWVDFEDLAPLIYLQYLCYGWGERFKVKHMVIDEAQDFSLFQFYVLKKIVKESTFTILGDLSQGIHSYRGIKDWQQLRELVFGVEQCDLLTLEQSYRTSVEIMEAANRVIRHLRDFTPVIAQPVIRHGKEVEIVAQPDFAAITSTMADQIVRLQQENFKSIAVICKTNSEAETVAKAFKSGPVKAVLISGKEEEYATGVIIVPSYLAKGLEFDAALIANANRENYREDDLDIKLLYVAMTRPLHRLIIYYHGELTPLLQ